MISHRTLTRQLKNIDQFLSAYHISQRPTHFESLIAQTISKVLHLPFYAIDNDDPGISHKVMWQGKSNPIQRAPGSSYDAISYCYNFKLLIEATLNTGVRQWSREFAGAIRHWEDYCTISGSPHNSVYVLLIYPTLHRDTYRSIKANPKKECKIIPIDISSLVQILETSTLAYSIRHIDIRKLIHQICDCLHSSSSEKEFAKSEDETISRWQKEVLRLEKMVFTGLKSYEAMRKIKRTHISMSEILQRLQKHPIVKHYFNIIEDKIGSELIKDSLINESFASLLSRTITDGEELFEPVPQCDYSGRCQRMINAVVSLR